MDTSMTNLNSAVQTWDLVLAAHRRVVARYRQQPQVEKLEEQTVELKQRQDDLHQDYDSFAAMRKSLGP
jgi:hypothetical protein